MTPSDLARCTGARIDRATEWLPYIEAAMAEFGINTDERKAAFLAQTGHESDGLHWTTEIWGPTPAQARYEGRLDLGNTQPGDGPLFRGHGLIQITGRSNHARARDRLRAKFPDVVVPDFEQEPRRLADPQWAALSAADFWSAHGCNELADAGDFERLTRRINGGLNGYQNRCDLWEAAKEVLT